MPELTINDAMKAIQSLSNKIDTNQKTNEERFAQILEQQKQQTATSLKLLQAIFKMKPDIDNSSQEYKTFDFSNYIKDNNIDTETFKQNYINSELQNLLSQDLKILNSRNFENNETTDLAGKILSTQVLVKTNDDNSNIWLIDINKYPYVSRSPSSINAINLTEIERGEKPKLQNIFFSKQGDLEQISRDLLQQTSFKSNQEITGPLRGILEDYTIPG
ncbi:MAG: hypothetical protein MK033_03325 [Candidatus Caenarcaniphilales bacterium]|nr:hypothetical protein [Candidatus Caenarcaniphilales bacterium]